jgi:Ca2+-binding EF-hand superfamily protein
VARRFGEGLTFCDEVKTTLFAQLDTNGDGDVSIDEFTKGLGRLSTHGTTHSFTNLREDLTAVKTQRCFVSFSFLE